MSKNTIIGLALCSALAFPVVNTAAEAGTSDKPTKTQAPTELQWEHTESLAHKMMGHISLAQMALGIPMPDEAARQIKNAQRIESDLASQLPELTIDSKYRFGKVTYDESTTTRDHYLPVLDDMFLLSDFEAVRKGSKTLGLNELDAGLVDVSVALDLREVEAGLANAENYIDKQQYGKARTALASMFTNSIVDETEIEDPELAIAGNLALAKAFLNIGEYDSARYTLKHIQKRLADAKDAKLLGNDKDAVARFSADLEELQKDLRKEDPTVTQRVSNRISHWAETVKDWFA
jgi:hypothetical protein